MNHVRRLALVLVLSTFEGFVAFGPDQNRQVQGTLEMKGRFE